MAARSRACAWAFTEYFEPMALISMLEIDGIPEGIRYIVGQLEKCPTTGRLHIQGYVELEESQRLSWLKKNLSPTANFGKRRKTREKARAYCMKEKTYVAGPWEFGHWKEMNQGSRSDLLEMKDMVDAKKPIKEIADAHFSSYIRYHRGIEKYISLSQLQRDATADPKVILRWGATGTGKSRWAYETYPDAYRKPHGTNWWDGYTGQEVVTLDEFSGRWFDFDLLLLLLDRYPTQVPFKGGYVHVRASTWVITSKNDYTCWYDGFRHPLEHLERRLTEIYQHHADGTVTREK